MALRSRDLALLDALDGLPGLSLDCTAWRIVREGRDPTDCSASGGRWDDASFDVLYTSTTRECCVAEAHFHVRRGQPIIPSKVQFKLYEVRLKLSNVLDLSDKNTLAGLGVNLNEFGSLHYVHHRGEYSRTQQIAEIAHFHGYDAILVPSARHDASNIVVFCDRADPDQIQVVNDLGKVTWPAI